MDRFDYRLAARAAALSRVATAKTRANVFTFAGSSVARCVGAQGKQDKNSNGVPLPLALSLSSSRSPAPALHNTQRHNNIVPLIPHQKYRGKRERRREWRTVVECHLSENMKKNRRRMKRNKIGRLLLKRQMDPLIHRIV